MRRDLLQLFYLASAILFVMGLRGLSHPRTARRGMFLAELGMLLAIIGSLRHHELSGYPITYRGQNFSNLLLLAAMLGLIPVLMFVPTSTPAFYTLVGLAFFFGVMLVLPIGAADMPVVIALLNSYAGLTDAAMGFML